MEPAHKIAELYQTVYPDEPLISDDSRYVDFSPARGREDVVSLISRRVTTAVSPRCHQSLLTGHRGSGKSTELHRLEASLKTAGFLVAYVDVEVTLDLADIEYLDVLLAIAYQLFITSYQNSIPVNDKLLKNVEDWFSEVVSISSEQYDKELTNQLKAQVGIEVPFLVRILTSATGQIRSGSTSRQEIRHKLEQRLDDLINRLSLLVNDITENARRVGFKGLVMIVDSLEKMPLKILDSSGFTNQSLLFVEHAEQLKAIPCHLVATVPVTLLNDRNLGIAFTEIDLIPMIKIATHQQNPWQAGQELLFDAVSRRVDVGALFTSPQLVYSLINATGGVIRDLMRLLLFAADYTPLEGSISEQAVESAIRKLIREYDRLIQQADLPTLVAVLKNPHLPGSSDLSRMMYNRLVLPYINDDNWKTLHPAVQASPTFRSFIDYQSGQPS